MKQFLSLLLLLYLSSYTNAQHNVPGAYYLKGVMEVGSGFLLKPDSTFQFFFSYGALDREGSGKWSTYGNKILLNSNAPAADAFTLITSKKSTDNFTTIKVLGVSHPFLKFIHALVKKGNAEEETSADEEGVIRIARTGIQQVVLLFEFTPEKISAFNLDSSKNYFEFKMNDAITEVFFENFALEIGVNELKGKHPVLKDREYTYERGNE